MMTLHKIWSVHKLYHYNFKIQILFVLYVSYYLTTKTKSFFIQLQQKQITLSIMFQIARFSEPQEHLQNGYRPFYHNMFLVWTENVARWTECLTKSIIWNQCNQQISSSWINDRQHLPITQRTRISTQNIRNNLLNSTFLISLTQIGYSQHLLKYNVYREENYNDYS